MIMYDNAVRNRFIDSLCNASNVDDIVKILKNNNKISQDGDYLDALEYYIHEISSYDRDIYTTTHFHALIKACRQKIKSIQDEFNLYKERYKEVSVNEQLKFEIIKSMLASGIKPAEINAKDVKDLVDKLLYTEDTQKISFTINENF